MSYLVINENEIIVNWENINPILSNGNVGIDIVNDNVSIRIGNGVSIYSELSKIWSGTNIEFQNIFIFISKKIQNIIDTHISTEAALKNVTDIETQTNKFNDYQIRQLMGVNW